MSDAPVPHPGLSGGLTGGPVHLDHNATTPVDPRVGSSRDTGNTGHG
ncbi:hypothetical protein J2S55_007623 [Streptosporangium brasiliense]|uniref:Uncharacterized protein n=1 Tax=Streptosporangium brasiliense TaxID=47480 RepID=A0ABT9RHL8_9ACTN|nr:hypothetical protein [Streptosporangium brasiliense]